jgi:LacI family transcriptional regulator
VSNVIHGKHTRAAKETVERISCILAAHHYTPNLSARALVNRSSRIIGVINHLFQSREISFFQDPFHGALLGGIENTLRERGFYLMVRTVTSEEELYSLFNNWNLDGVILTGLFNDRFFARLLEARKPVVLVDSYIKNESIFNVGLDDWGGGYLAAQYLIRRGHRNIVFASPPVHPAGVVEERFKGYRAALEENGIPFSPENLYQQEITLNEGIALGRTLGRRRDISAVFATADILAAGILSGLNQEGRRVPRDISVVGFDDIFYSRISSPPLTTIRQDAEGKGALAAGIMADYLQGKDPGPRNIVMPVSLVERDSVRTLRQEGGLFSRGGP